MKGEAVTQGCHQPQWGPEGDREGAMKRGKGCAGDPFSSRRGGRDCTQWALEDKEPEGPQLRDPGTEGSHSKAPSPLHAGQPWLPSHSLPSTGFTDLSGRRTAELPVH